MNFTKRRLTALIALVVVIGFAAGWFFGRSTEDEAEPVVVADSTPAVEAAPDLDGYPAMDDAPPEEVIVTNPDPVEDVAEVDEMLDMDAEETPYTAAGEVMLDEERVVRTTLPEYPPRDAAPGVPDETVDSLEVTVDEGEIEALSRPFKIPENSTRTLLDGALVIGVNEVTTDHVIVNLNTRKNIMTSGDFVETELGGMACRLMLLDFSWNLSTPYADFTLNCDTG